MKNKILKYSLFIGVIAVLLAVMLAGYAAAEAGFEDVVAGIDKTGTWAERSSRVTEADALYSALSEEEKAAASESYALLLAEKVELETIALYAHRFIAYIGTLSDLYDLNEKEYAVYLANSDGVYFSDASYPGIADALAELSRFEANVTESVNACIAFMDAVDLALLTDTNDYAALRAALDKAEQYYHMIDNSYDGVGSAASTYGMLSSELRVREAYTEEFLSAAEKLKEKVDYKSYLERYTDAKEYMSDESFIKDFPGVDEAVAILNEADAYMKECLARANVFIAAVSRFGSSDNIANDLALAYIALDGVDLTVNGAATAKLVFDTTLKAYNDTVSAILKDLAIL